MAKLEAWARWELRVNIDQPGGQDFTVGRYATEAAAKGQATRHQKVSDRYGLGKTYTVRQDPSWQDEPLGLCDYGDCIEPATCTVANKAERRPVCERHAVRLIELDCNYARC